MVLQPYNGVYEQKRGFVKPVFKAKWADVARHVNKLGPCLQPRGGGPPQGGYTVFTRKSNSSRLILTLTS